MGFRVAPLCIWTAGLLAASGLISSAFAGPPYLSDDPEPTDYRHYEIYGFAAGAREHAAWTGAAGIDFNYGATPDLQLTAVLPVEFNHAAGGASVRSLGNFELAAKLRILHQQSFGWDVAAFPRVFLPSLSDRVGEDRASLLLPVWIGRDDGPWSMFGGAGCALHRGGDAKDYCQAGWALTRQVMPTLRLGGEIFHQSADVKGGRSENSMGFGATYDVNDGVHMLASVNQLVGPADSQRTSFYTSVLFTF